MTADAVLVLSNGRLCADMNIYIVIYNIKYKCFSASPMYADIREKREWTGYKLTRKDLRDFEQKRGPAKVFMLVA